MDKVYAHYGQECACCGETDPLFLTIDHVNNDGKAHREAIFGKSGKRTGGYIIGRWLIDNDFPPGFQILCFNCNCGKERNGGICPHKTRKQS